MPLTILTLVVCLLAAVLQFAAFRAPDIRDTHLTRIGRRVMIVALIVAAIYIADLLFTRTSGSAAIMVLFLVALSQIVFALSDLLPHLEKEYPWTSHLTNSR